jgi:3-oxoacyl-[acyl-carrier-protein] synthase-3
MLRTVIAATGSHIPPVRVPNSDFLNHDFRDADGSPLPKTNAEIVKQFEAITGIKERRYVESGTVTSDIAYASASDALTSSGIDPESLDLIIVPTTSATCSAGADILISFPLWPRESKPGCASPKRGPPPLTWSSAARAGFRESSLPTP